MMDVSDGLAKDLDAITPRGLAPALSASAIPISRAAHEIALETKSNALQHALCDGEDYELLIAVRARANSDAFEAAWRKRFPKLKLTHLGHFAPGNRVPKECLPLASYHGYEHLS